MRISPLQASLLISSIFNIGLGAYVLLKQERKPDIIGLALMAIGMGGWVGTFALLSVTQNSLFDIPNHISGLLFVLGLFILSQVFPRGDLRKGNFLYAYVPFGLGLITILSGKVVEQVNFGPNGEVIPVQGSLFPVYGLFLIAYLAWSIVLLVKSFRKSEGQDVMRMKYFFAGILVFAIGAIIGDVLLPAVGFPYFNMIGPLSSVAFITFTGYAIVRHQLLDVRIVIQRGLIYSVVALLLLALYALLLGIVGLVIETSSSANPVVVGGITILIGVFTAPHLERYLRRKTDPIFFKDRYDYKQAIKTLSNVVVTSKSFDELVKRIEKELSDILRSDGAKLELHDEARVPNTEPQNHESPRIPVFFNGSEIAAIHPGHKKSGDNYSKEDIELLETIALHAASALERVRLYQKLSLHAAVLEMKVKERTAALEDLQKREHQMLADISHNLQTPLTIFQTKLEHLQKNKKISKEVKGLQTSLTRLSEFIYDLLKFARLENEKQATHEAFSLSNLLKESIDEIKIIAQASKIEVKSSVFSGISISGNVKQISEAIMNITSNAVKHTKGRKTKRISISLRKKNGSAILTLTDTGAGISKEDLEHIFERYYSAKRTGTGLGLAITKQIVENHNGTIGIESKVGKGTKVILTLPLA